ncbi:MAG: division/cell wall cluster transcriptional repressor MraZ [Clostridia bacterium]|nr:division/cell wall cluster transcriptional repressor MraZ [Oscillospiraceae bacterium]MBQ6701472.1 division/cell wall cluster transcriptional repressor MraZ [Clostridia bacterium]
MIGEYMFTGEYKHSIDPKNRMFLPANMREELGEEVFVVKGVDTCIAVYPKEAWEEFTEKLNQLPEMKARRVKRTLLASAIKTKLDGQGRVLISQGHKAYAGLDKNVYVIGVGNHVEIWDEDKWIAENDMNSEELAETLMSLGF